MTGLEPATSAVTGQRSNRLSYTPVVNDGEKPPLFITESRVFSRISKTCQGHNALFWRSDSVERACSEGKKPLYLIRFNPFQKG